MKTYILILLLVCTNSLFAQQLDNVIYANDQKNVALFFPSPIRQGIPGKSNFVFTYNREKQQYFGLLQAKPGTESNLLVVTSDGQVYSYILKYAEKLPRINYFISKNESIGNEKPVIIPLKKEIVSINPYANRRTYFEKFSAYQLKTKYVPISTKRKKGVKLQLQKMSYNEDEVYLVLEIKNRSGIDFEIDFLNVYRTNGNKKKKASYQRLEQRVLHSHNMPEIIKIGQSHRLVLVVSKIVLGDNEKLEIELRERKGHRKVNLISAL
ncbi:DUF4138 domain-containing protein [Flagellimonas nanhaiensis]|uniref:DUF4138 domain-containing protein n=1 Tax=Flagellimonas nanhaiensis TaxID=2292706 RepID=A0A371JMZ2_9FLAO|nr:DUF4138 domain-containing protein [Allomuricauda nanhaiensis]RDY58601.1 DUF4138 domain-containing protein [Allomuricauda nanhaiensis]